MVRLVPPATYGFPTNWQAYAAMSLPLDPLAGGTVFKPPPEELPELLPEEEELSELLERLELLSEAPESLLFAPFSFASASAFAFSSAAFFAAKYFAIIPALFLGLDDRVFFLIQPCQLGILLFD